MNKAILICLIHTAVFMRGGISSSQEIRYVCDGAGEVFVVWGINNWQTPPADKIPPGSWIKDKLVYTPMTLNSEKVFTVVLSVEQGAIIDYVFWITRGPLQKGMDVWDTNSSKDFHTYAGSNTVALIESRMNILPARQPSVLDFSWLLLWTCAACSAFFFFTLRYYFKTQIVIKPLWLIASAGISFLLFSILIRASVAGLAWKVLLDPFHSSPQLLWSAYYDILFILILTVLFGTLAWFSKNRWIQRTLCTVFSVIVLLSLIVSLANIRIVELLGKPFNYQWLYYSDFLKSNDAKTALSSNISREYLYSTLCVGCSAVFLTLTIVLFYNLFHKVRIKKAVFASVSVLAIVYLIITPRKLNAYGYHYDKLANPVWAFLSSASPLAEVPELFTMQVPDSLLYVQKLDPLPIEKLPHQHIKNVLVIVLESTPAEYIDVYGGRYGITPCISKMAERSFIFENVYAHAPATNLSMVSLLGSIYPWLSYNSFTREHPDMDIPTISSQLNSRGYRTAFFNSGDNNYQRAGEFLSYRGFDLVSDYQDSACRNNKFEPVNTTWEHMGGKDDHCTAEQLLKWTENDTTKPFFAVMWTYQTHYPYFFREIEKKYVSNDIYFNRYLNALNYADSIIGKIYFRLEQIGKQQSTLIVIVGDHGEAFGRHSQITHGRKIYEENLHIPCIFINPSFPGERMPHVGGMVDVAPTILNFLGIAPPEKWVGESLMAKTASSKTYFFAPWSDYLFGYREGDYKFIYNATTNETEFYNLKKDSLESVNLAHTQATKSDQHILELAAWTQRVNAAMAKITR